MKKARSSAPGFSFVQPLPVAIVVAVSVVRSIAIIGVRARTIAGAAVVAVARSITISIRMRRGDRTRGDRAGGQTKCEARTDAATARLSRSRRCDCGYASRRNVSQNSQCLLHDPLLRIWRDNAPHLRWLRAGRNRRPSKNSLE